jgi:FlaG/FlaF family flagellin (archaellin)
MSSVLTSLSTHLSPQFATGSVHTPTSNSTSKPVDQAALQMLKGGTTSTIPLVDRLLVHFGGAGALKNATPQQKHIYAQAYNAGFQAKKTTPGALPPNTHGPGMHDSRDTTIINANPSLKATFAKETPQQKQQTLFQIDFYLAGADAEAKKN